MNESTKYILNAIKTWVWSGFYELDEVHEMIDDILETDADETFLRSAVAAEFAEKAAAEASWPEHTDCDRLDEAFESLNAFGIVALQNAGYTMSDGLSDVAEVLHERERNGMKGYCFYHGQDVERGVAGDGLMIAFGDLDDDRTKKGEIGEIVKQMLEQAGLTVKWDGDPDNRLSLPLFDWKRRAAV